MNTVPVAALWGALAALPLLLGAWIALSRAPRTRTVGLVAAFGAGALVSAVSFDLVEDALTQGRPATLAVALAAGAITYFVGDEYLGRRSSAGSGARGLALMLGAALDGIPESFILGLSVASGSGVSLAFFVAVLVSNFPEGMTSAADLKGDPEFSNRKILLMWLAVVVVSAFFAGLGALTVGASGTSGAIAQAFAAGALLTMLIDDLIPEARGRAGLATGLVGVLGFAVALALHQLGG